MAYIPFIGAVALGTVIGWLVRFMWKRIQKFEVKVLSATLTAIFGGIVAPLVSGEQNLIWFYVFGLFLGFVLYSVVAVIAVKKEDNAGDFEGILYSKQKNDRK